MLGSNYPGLALRPMQRLGLLTEALPEFGRIDSLVVRDFYHRYTVDEHSLRTIEHLQDLAGPLDSKGERFAPLWKTANRRDLLILALLLHDVGKGMPVDHHVTGSLEALDSAAARLQLSAEEKTEVKFLIERIWICPQRCSAGIFSMRLRFRVLPRRWERRNDCSG